MKTLSVYIHIPFCVHKCNYCDFLSAPATEAARKQYVEALKREIMQESLQYKEYSVDTVFFGGGTPSILKGEEIAECMETLRQYYQVSPDAEVTLEMNPGTADRNKLQILKKAGINRLSLGLQSTEDSLLRILGRIHTYEEFLQVYRPYVLTAWTVNTGLGKDIKESAGFGTGAYFSIQSDSGRRHTYGRSS